MRMAVDSGVPQSAGHPVIITRGPVCAAGRGVEISFPDPDDLVAHVGIRDRGHKHVSSRTGEIGVADEHRDCGGKTAKARR